MDKLEKVIKGLECCWSADDKCYECPYMTGVKQIGTLNGEMEYVCECDKLSLCKDALAMLKAQEPRLVTETDFANADECGYITAWCEASNGLFAECITIRALQETDFRYWTSRPTDEQMEATPLER